MSVTLQTNNQDNSQNNQQLNDLRSGNLMQRAVCWLKEPGKYEITRKILAFAAAFFLTLTIIGIPLVIAGVREWNKDISVVPSTSTPSDVTQQPQSILPVQPVNQSTSTPVNQPTSAPINQPPPSVPISTANPQQNPEILFKSIDFSQIPQGIHYDLFNVPESEPNEFANNALSAIFDFISEQLQGEKDPSKLLNLGKSSLAGWKLNTPISSLSDDQILKFQNVEITGKELKRQLLSTKVSYIPQAGLTLEQLKTMLTKGSGNDEQRVLARSRCISSLVTMLCSPDGEPIQRKIDEKLPEFHMYTLNLPNLRYEVIEADKQQFLLPDGSLNKEAYKQEYKRILEHYLLRCRSDGVQVPILSGAGLDAFMPQHLQPEAAATAGEAIKELLTGDSFNQFTGIIFAAFQEQTAQTFAEILKDIPKVNVVKGSSFWIAYEGAKQGLKMGMINPGDPSCIPGQFWEGGHIALEELVALFTTVIFSQHPHFNPLITDTAHYKATPVSTSSAPQIPFSGTVSQPIPQTIPMEVNPRRGACGVGGDRFSSPPINMTPIKLGVAGTKEASCVIDAVAMPQLKNNEIFRFDILHEGVSKTIGAVASLLLPGGNSIKKARNQEDIPYVYFDNENGKHKFCINFKSAEYAQRLSETLKAIGLSSVKFDPNLEILNKYGFFRGCVSISDPKQIIYFIKYICDVSYPQDLIKNSLNNYKTIDQPFAAKLLAELNADLSQVGSFSQIQKDSLIIAKEKILAEGISQTIGAMTSLLIPGLNSVADAKRLQNILNVSIDSKEGLSLNFADEKSAKKVLKALHKPPHGEAFVKMTFAPIDLNTKYGRYNGAIRCNDPQTIIRYLRQVCKLHPLDIIDLVQSKNFNEGVTHPILQSDLGQQLLSMAKFRLSNETAEDLGGKTLFQNLKQIDLDLYEVCFEKLGFSKLPDLSDDEAKRPLNDLITKLDTLLLNCDPSILEDEGKKCSPQYMREGMQKFVAVLNGDSDHYGMPSGNAAKAKWRTSMCLMMKHVLVLLDDTAIDGTSKKNLLLSIAAGGKHCAGRYSQEASQAYASLAAQTSNPRYIDSSINKNLCFADITVISKCKKLLERMRREIFEKVCAVVHVEFHGQDMSHTRNRCMKLIGQDRGIPGAQVADYEDVYELYAAHVSKDQLLKKFDSFYTPHAITEYFYKNAHYPDQTLGMKPEINGQDLVDFFVHHAPEDVQQGTLEDKMEIIVEDSLLTIKKTYLIQMLQFLDVIAPK